MTESQALEKLFTSELKRGDITAYEKALFLYEKAIFNYVYRLLGQRQDAEDLTQETFLKLYQKRHQIDINKNFKAWLYKIATNTVRDWWRRKKGRTELFIIDNPENQFETIDENPAYYRIERAHDLELAFNNIKPVYKTVLILFYQQDFDYQTIAEMLNLPINTVKTYLRRAKFALKQELEKYG